MKAKVMLATAFGPGRAWCVPILHHVLSGLQCVSKVLIAWDGTSMWEVGSPLAKLPYRIWHHELPPWEGDPDPFRYGRLARMRRALRETFLTSDCDYLYFHDCDMIPPVDIVPRLLSLDVPVATGTYPLRNLDHALPAWMEPERDTIGEDVVIAHGYGMGCMLIRRDVVESSPFREPEYWVGKDAPGEDWQWSIDNGVPVHCDTRLSCWHCGEDGQAARVEFSPLVNLLAYVLDKPVENKWGYWTKWRHAGIDLTAKEASELPHGFVYGPARPMSLEWAATEDILAGRVEAQCTP